METPARISERAGSERATRLPRGWQFYLLAAIILFVLVETGGNIKRVNTPPADDALVASPNPVPFGIGDGMTTITWRVRTGDGQVWLSINGTPEVLFAEGGSGTVTAPWIASNTIYIFRLYEKDRGGRLLKTITVTRGG